ncbi:SDR family NAD(P)-dependent oxidoreductase [Amycolatopsis albispora]|uniref:SDR family NAD(P)-dependent oxidoreductase n=1 Tax=Amycolatopsis albispora TaxID=1804986 RepID=A0A344L3X7_9PSEU|nr:SDR family NAD(P)-dependent oxidoreductase [Amycolatopsis albispora]AXB42751.1 hypothetical protein A4R43_09595 [Amycolatopsis albispora]
MQQGGDLVERGVERAVDGGGQFGHDRLDQVVLRREVPVQRADRGALVVLACRNPQRAEAAAARIGGRTEVVRLASLESVRAAADEIRARHERIDLLVNNAGVTGRTEEGFEVQFGVNHLGHFAFIGHRLDRLLGRWCLRSVEAGGASTGFRPDTGHGRAADAARGHRSGRAGW